jgi:hypothetical protein
MGRRALSGFVSAFLLEATLVSGGDEYETIADIPPKAYRFWTKVRIHWIIWLRLVISLLARQYSVSRKAENRRSSEDSMR